MFTLCGVIPVVRMAAQGDRVVHAVWRGALHSPGPATARGAATRKDDGPRHTAGAIVGRYPPT